MFTKLTPFSSASAYSASSAAIPEPDNPHNEDILLASVRAEDKHYLQYYLSKYGQATINRFSPCEDGILKGRSVTPLHLAVNLQNLDMADFLLDQGADINSKMTGNQTVLKDCISSRNIELLNLLLEKGVEPEKQDDVLHMACKEAWPEGVTQLLKAQYNPTVKDKSGLAPIHYAGDLSIPDATKIVKLLVAHDPGSVNLPSEPEGLTPLYKAITSNNKPLTAFLLDSGANPKTSGNQSIFKGCIPSRNVDLLNFLLEKGVEPDKQDDVLHMVCKEAWTDGITQLLKAKCISTLKDECGLAPIHYAGRLSRPDATNIVKMLVEDNPDNVNLQSNPEGCTPLHQAIANNNESLVAFLLHSGANINIRGRATERLQVSRNPDCNDKEAYPVDDKCDFCCYFSFCYLFPFRLCYPPVLKQYIEQDMFVQDTLCPCWKPTPLKAAAQNDEIRLILQPPQQATRAVVEQQPVPNPTPLPTPLEVFPDDEAMGLLLQTPQKVIKAIAERETAETVPDPTRNHRDALASAAQSLVRVGTPPPSYSSLFR